MRRGNRSNAAKSYRVACNDFMATGGDDYDVLSHGANRAETGILVRDVLERLVMERSKDGGALDYRQDGRIKRVGARFRRIERRGASIRRKPGRSAGSTRSPRA